MRSALTVVHSTRVPLSVGSTPTNSGNNNNNSNTSNDRGNSDAETRRAR